MFFDIVIIWGGWHNFVGVDRLRFVSKLNNLNWRFLDLWYFVYHFNFKYNNEVNSFVFIVKNIFEFTDRH